MLPSNKCHSQADLTTEWECKLTTACTNQSTGLTNGEANWALEVEFSPFRDKAALIRVNTTSSSTNTLATFVLRIDDFFRSYCKTNRHYLRFDFSVISSSTRSLRPQSLARLGELVKIPFHARKLPATVHVRCQLFGLLEQVSKTRRHFEGRNH